AGSGSGSADVITNGWRGCAGLTASGGDCSRSNSRPGRQDVSPAGAACSGRHRDEEATDPVANREFYEGFSREDPGREAALLRNTKTGEYVVVQGSER